MGLTGQHIFAIDPHECPCSVVQFCVLDVLTEVLDDENFAVVGLGGDAVADGINLPPDGIKFPPLHHDQELVLGDDGFTPIHESDQHTIFQFPLRLFSESVDRFLGDGVPPAPKELTDLLPVLTAFTPEGSDNEGVGQFLFADFLDGGVIDFFTAQEGPWLTVFVKEHIGDEDIQSPLNNFIAWND
jgi:hypothetical protein